MCVDSGGDKSPCSTLSPIDLHCEYRIDPLGIDNCEPILSWRLESNRRAQRQTAYRILVAGSRALLDAEQGDLWDSGKIESNESLYVLYGGKKLVSRQQCYWKVRVWDRDDSFGPWSEPARWEMAFVEPSDWKAEWISDGKALPERDEGFYDDDPAPLFRTQFDVKKSVRSARLYISGLGYYEARLNGMRVGDRVLEPGWTDYEKRVLYSIYDVSSSLQAGVNCLAVMLGNGWWNPYPLRMWGRINLRETLTVGRPQLIAQLEVEYTDGQRETVVTDKTWKVAEGPILQNGIFLGEVYDARKEVPEWDTVAFDDSRWCNACRVIETLGSMQVQPQPPIKVAEIIRPVALTEPEPGVFIFDMGQNFAGWVRLRAFGPEGTSIVLRYGELLHGDGSLNVLTSTCGQIKQAGTGGPGAPEIAEQRDLFTLKGKGEEQYEPRFTFHGFRYVEVRGYPGKPALETVEGCRVHTNLESRGTFECSNETLNRIHAMVRATFLSNVHSVQSDCPTRERFGYGGDIVATADAFLMNFDMATFYAKVVNDFAETARDDGSLAETAPEVGIADDGMGTGGPIGWTLAFPLLLKKLFQHYGNRRLIEKHYDTVRRHVKLLQTVAKDHIIDVGISDHESIDPKPVTLTSTAFYYHHVRLLAEFSALLEYYADAATYNNLADNIRSAACEKFHNSDTGIFYTSTQTCQAVALYYDWLEPEQHSKVLEELLKTLDNNKDGRISTGIFGTAMLLDVLGRNGHMQKAFEIVTGKSCPGWGHMLDEGATTLWEHWLPSNDTYSHNHPMFGSVDTWLYEHMAGIRLAAEAVGFDRVIIQPPVVKGVEWVRASHFSLRGRIACHWRIAQNCYELNLKIPVNTTAEVHMPGTSNPALVIEGGKPISEIAEIALLDGDNNSVVFEIGSGSYNFETLS